MAFWAFRKKNRDSERVVLTLLAQKLETELKQFLAHDVLWKLQAVYDEMKLLDSYQIAQEVLYANQKFFEYRDKPEKELARLLSDRPDNKGRFLKVPLGDTKMDVQQQVAIFQEYF